MSKSMTDIRRTAHHWRSRMADGGLSASEQIDFDGWLANPNHANAFLEAERLWETLGAIEYPSSVDQPIPFEIIRNGLLEGRRMIVDCWQSFTGKFVLASIVCSIAVLTVMSMESPSEPAAIVNYEQRRYTTGRGEIEVITLTEGSRITLGARSNIDITISDTKREAHLHSGVAFFEVSRSPGRDFTVEASNAKVRVLGTAFDVQNKSDGLYVAVEEGIVRVSYPTPDSGTSSSDVYRQPDSDGPTSEVTLLAGQGVNASGHRGLGQVTKVDATSVGAWRSGQLVYVRATLAEIIEDVNRYSTQPIRVGPVAKALTLSGTFNANDTDALLTTLEVALPVRIEERSGIRFLVADH